MHITSTRIFFQASLLLTALLIVGPSTSDAQEPAAPQSHQVLSGKIKVNGKSVAPGFAVASGDTVETAKGSSAVVSLGKLGRVEALPSSKMKVTFDTSKITIELESGGAGVTKTEGTTATVTTDNGEIVANTPLAGSFTVETTCGSTVVTSHTVAVQWRATGGDGRTTNPGTHDAIGRTRPGCRTKPAKAPAQ